MYEITYEPIEAISCHPNNPNEGDVDSIRKSIRRFGWAGLIVVQRSTGYALVGNNRLVAAAAEGVESVPVLWADLSDEQSARFLVAHNLTRQKAKINDTKLLAVMAQLDSFEGTGFTYADYERLRDALTPPAGFGGGPGDLDNDSFPSNDAPSVVQIKIGTYQFSVDADVWGEFYDYLMRDGDFIAATDEVKQRLGFAVV